MIYNFYGLKADGKSAKFTTKVGKKMAELVVAMVREKSDVVSALRMKSLLWEKGIELSGMVVKKEENNGAIPLEFLEEMVQLKIIGVLS